MKVLVFGKTGQVARELQRRAPKGVDLLALDRDAADLFNPAACATAITDHAPDAVINAAAWTGVDSAEAEEAHAHVINAEAPGAMARACATRGIPFVHISTDYVFDGSGSAPVAPDATTRPLGAYGRTKLAGEEAVRAAGGVYAILRTSWVFSAHGSNFVKTMLQVGATRDALNVVEDQIGGPTPADGIADACLTIAMSLRDDPGLTGTYHYAGKPNVSWADFARAIFARAGMKVSVNGIPTSAWPTPAARPANSRLDCSSLTAAFGITPPNWQAALGRVIADSRKETI